MADSDTFVRALYEQHGPLLLRFATRLLGGDWHRAEDVVQEAAVRAWRNEERFGAAPDGLRPWLFTVVRNLVIDDHRARQARPVERHPAHFALSATGPEAEAVDLVERALTAQVVAEALRDLTDQQREILAHTYFLGHSVAQVSQALGIPGGTVKSRTFYAMRALRTALATRGVHG
ncbi:sigma-70 family RNA polymerase sigma factor [Streptomyces sparsus]